MHSSEIHSCEIVVKMHLRWPTFNKIPSQRLWQARKDIEVPWVPDVSTTRQRFTKKIPSDGVRLQSQSCALQTARGDDKVTAPFENSLVFDLITGNDTGKNNALTSHFLTQNRQQLESKRTSFWHIADIQRDPWRRNLLDTC